MRYKIDFGLIFFTCVFIISFSKVWTILGDYPEAFKYGSIIYQIVDLLLYVLGNLSIGVAATIIFYYIQQLIEKKRNFDLYTELRRILLFMFYKHLVILSEIENFKEIKQRDRKVTGLWGYDIFDIPVLIRLYNEINTEELKEKLKNNLIDHFISMSDQQLKEFSNSFQKEIDELKTKESIRYFKESNELIMSLCISYEDDFSLITDIYVRDRNESNLKDLTEEIVNDYINFLDATFVLYQELKIFIDSIEKKKIMVFIKMLD